MKIKSNLFISVAFLLVMSVESYSQVFNTCYGQTNLTLELDDDIMKISEYKLICNSDKVFINWTLKNQNTDCIYIIEKSENGSSFKPVGAKFITSSDIEVFYSWVDNSTASFIANYKIKKIRNNFSETNQNERTK